MKKNKTCPLRVTTVLLIHLCLLIPGYAESVQLPNGEEDLLDLDRALSLAVYNSLEIRAKRQAITLEKTGYRTSLREIFPRVTVSFSDNAVVKDFGEDSLGRQLSLRIEQPLSRGGKGLLERSLSRAQITLLESELATLIDSVKDQTWQVYQEVKMLREKLKLQTESLNIFSLKMKILSKEKEQGDITPLEHSRAELQYKTSSLQISKTRLELGEKEYNLLHLTGFTPKTSLLLDPEDFWSYNGIPIEADADWFFEIALTDNPEAAAARFELRQKEGNLKLYRFRFIPDLSLQADLGVSGASFPLNNYSGSFTLVFKMPGLESRANIVQQGPFKRSRTENLNTAPFPKVPAGLARREIQTTLNVSKKGFDQLTDRLRYSISTSLKQYALLKRELSLKRETLALLKMDSSILQKKQELGEVRLYELLSSQVNIAKQEVEIISFIMDLKIAERNLEKLIGLAPGRLSEIDLKEE